ncbi:MAG: TldD/PmbA family protein [Candidatus Hydrogenedentes bacterium]|nr:TldD/PmbA family protein [Candidatus Hydrogenedentota bacterium]
MNVPGVLLDEALAAAAALGAADAEIVLSTSADFEVEVADGQVETLALAECIGAGVRLFTDDRRMGFAYRTDFTGGMRRLVESAWQNAKASEPDEHNLLPDSSLSSHDDWAEQDFQAVPVQDKIEFARRLEQKTLHADTRIAQVQTAHYSDCRFELAIASSRGLRRSYRNAFCACHVVARAAQVGLDPEMGWEFDFGRTFDSLRVDWCAQSCAQDALRRLGGAPCASGAMPIVLDNRVVAQILQVLGPALMADSVLRGKSLYAGRLGEPVASECVEIVDENECESGLNRAPFDGEGASAQRTLLVEGGVLKTFLHNTYTAHIMDAATTANASRSGFKGVPHVGATNCFLAPGAGSQADLIAAAGDGLLVTETMGMHTADPISGDFSFGAAGLAIQRGQPARPVRGVTLAGNIRDLMTNIASVGSDLRFFGAYGAPSVMISELMVSGE